MRPNKLLYIDALRGIAILMVIACHQALPFYHLSPLLVLAASYGQTGVMLFFLVSAYTLCNSDHLRQGEAHKTRNFFLRRWFRIAPLYYAGIALYYVIDQAFPDIWTDYDFTASNVLANIALVHGLVPSASDTVVPGGWSVGTECVFYALFPLLLPACRWLYRNGGWKLFLIPIVLFTAFSASLLPALGMDDPDYWFWYNSLLHQLPVFLIGIALFLATQEGRFQPRLRRDIPAFLVLTAIGVVMLGAELFGLLPLTCALSFLFLFNIVRAWDGSYGLLHRIGRASYSMYIFHFVFAIYVTRMILRQTGDLGGWGNAAYFLALAITTGASYLTGRISEHLIEKRFIEIGRAVTRLGAPAGAISPD